MSFSDTAVLPVWRPFNDQAAIWLNSGGLPYGAMDEQMYGTYLTRNAAEFLSGNVDQPFFAYVAFQETHSPFHFPIDFEYRCDAENIVPPEPPSDLSKLPMVFENLTRKEKQGIIASYYTCASFMDGNIGIILDALEGSRFARNTLVVFSSDHGYMLGHRGLFEKHCCYEPSIRVPLLVRFPDGLGAGSSSRELVPLIDIVPTLLDICGIEQPLDLPGKSLLALITEKQSTWRDYVVSHYSDNEEACLVEKRWKLIYRTGNRLRRDGYRTTAQPGGPSVELYDLQEDPEETRDLAGAPTQRARAACMVEKLADHMAATVRDPTILSGAAEPHEILNACLTPPDSW
jgi:choline-sulfatase